LSEGTAAEQAGLDVLAVLDVIAEGRGAVVADGHRGKTMVADRFDFGFAVG
jgi:3-hydroxyisobutyrate dehydrogenase-like beta-hydroxyacid dehydrogenase